jgi:16S rRNA (cytidine1402-2'-O)-methyltransferase
MSGTLYVVATPIGNLEDVTLRALRILRDVSLIAAEDTRRTARLLQHYSISTPTTSLHAHNERQKTPRLIARLTRGDSVALVSDAGTPLVSDPGHGMVAAARKAGVRIETVPGPSAVMAALSIAGFDASQFAFLGFPPVRAKALDEWARSVAEARRLTIFFEAPHRIHSTILALAQHMSPDRDIVLARELTKVHEQLVVCQIATVLACLPQARGEFTVIVPPAVSGKRQDLPADATHLTAEVGRMIQTHGLSRREAIRKIAQRYGFTTNQLYDLLQRE